MNDGPRGGPEPLRPLGEEGVDDRDVRAICDRLDDSLSLLRRSLEASTQIASALKGHDDKVSMFWAQVEKNSERMVRTAEAQVRIAERMETVIKTLTDDHKAIIESCIHRKLAPSQSFTNGGKPISPMAQLLLDQGVPLLKWVILLAVAAALGQPLIERFLK